MKSRLIMIACVFVAFAAIGIIGFLAGKGDTEQTPSPTPQTTATPTEEPAEPSPTPDKVDAFISYINKTLDSTSFEGHYTAELSEYGILIRVWKDGFFEKLESLKTKNSKKIRKQYEELKSEAESLAKEIDKKAFDYGVDYYNTKFIVLNDSDKENFFLFWKNGELEFETTLVAENPTDAPSETPAPDDSESESKYANYLKYALEQTSYKNSYKLLADDYTIIIQLWQDGFADLLASLLKKDNKSLREEYEGMKAEFEGVAKSLYSRAQEYGVSKNISLYILNENDLDDLLLVWKNGELVFEALE